MNSIKYIIISVLLLLNTWGCEKDFLETIPTDRIASEIFWQTDQDAIFAANAIYPFLLENAFVFVMWDAMSDIGHVTLQWRDESIMEKGAYTSTSGKAGGTWAFAYEGIQAANIFFANIDRVDAVDQALIDRLKAEVKAIRAYLYINLALLYGDIPLITEELDIPGSKELTRTPVSQVWDFINQELNNAAAALPTTQTEPGRITKGAALAINARAMLYAKRYSEAAALAKSVMDLNVYSLYPSYENLFSYAAQNSSEVILDRQFEKNINNNDIFNLTTPNSVWPQVNQFVPTRKVVDSYQMTNGLSITDPDSGFDPANPYDNRDPRLKYSIYVLGSTLVNGATYDPRPNSSTGDAIGSSENSTYSGYNVRKYLNPEDIAQPNNCGINLILMRYAEVLLIYAEAKIEGNQIDQTVLDAINEVRARQDVNMPPIEGITDQNTLRELVRNERMVELAFEGFRFFDIRRWEIAEDVIPGTIFGMTWDNSGTLETIELTGYLKAFDPRRDYLWPIPFNEIVLNSNLTQNPNY